MRRGRRRVWVVAFPNSELLDITGPWEVMSHANDVLGSEQYALELVTPSRAPLRTRHGLTLTGARTLSAAAAGGFPERVVVAGGMPRLPLPPAEAAFAAWARRNRAGVREWVAICTGAFVLGEAGLLDGRRATTHWRWAAELRQRFPRAHVVDDGIFQRSGPVWTSAGISAGIDLTLALVERDHGHAVAMAVAKNLVLFLRRSGSQAQFSEPLRHQSATPSGLRELSTFVLEHLTEPLSVERLARGLGMSARSLTRACRAELGESPAAVVRRLRVERACQLLEETSLPLKSVAMRVGLGDPSTLYRVFLRQLGVAPADYRARFSALKT